MLSIDGLGRINGKHESSECSVPGPGRTTARLVTTHDGVFCYSDIVGTPFELSRIMQEPGSPTIRVVVYWTRFLFSSPQGAGGSDWLDTGDELLRHKLWPRDCLCSNNRKHHLSSSKLKLDLEQKVGVRDS